MKTNLFRPAKCVGLVLSAALLPVLIGCVSSPDRRSVRVNAPHGYVRTEIVLDDDYVYYPGYEVYYSNSRRSFVYRDGRNWVSRPAPQHVSIDILLASPSVRVDFRDAPERHHSNMVKRYPRHWHPSDRRDGSHRDRHDNRHDNRRDRRDNDRDRD